ncbi:hypothetical protein C8R46DRAFT_1247549 [Mycena filopes]|nr:hypothetical protein C8R46DRAFT_1247549 [Mycena filopes]
MAAIVQSVPLNDHRWNEPNLQCFDTVVSALFSLWSLHDSQWPIPAALTRYFASRKSRSVVYDCLSSSRLVVRLLPAVPTTLSQLPSLDSDATPVDELMVTVWLIATCFPMFITPHIFQPILEAITGFSVTPIIFSTVSLVKTIIVHRTTVEEPAARSPGDTADRVNSDDLTEQRDHDHQQPNITEVQLTVLADFLEGWTTLAPYELMETTRCMADAIGTPGQVGEELQQRLARCMTHALQDDNLPTSDVFYTLTDSSIFRVYSAPALETTMLHPWLSDATARNEVWRALSDHLERQQRLSSASLKSLLRLRGILRRLESLHPPPPRVVSPMGSFIGSRPATPV